MFDHEILSQRLTDYAGEFESHITVLCDQNQFELFRRRCEEMGAKALVIELNVGDRPIQPMLCKRHSDSASDTLKDISKMIASLASEFEIERVKVEASLSNSGIPTLNSSAENLPVDCYFEHHVKIELPVSFDEEKLRDGVKVYSGHLSKNPLNTDNSKQRRFVTQRFYRSTMQCALSQLEELERFLVEANYEILQVIREFNIYDSNIERDAGWIT